MANDAPQDGQVQPPIISEYADGGFTIGGAFTKGGVLITGAEGTGFTITSWAVDDPEMINAASLAPLYQADTPPNLIVLGVGAKMQHPFLKLRAELSKQAIAVEDFDYASSVSDMEFVVERGTKSCICSNRQLMTDQPQMDAVSSLRQNYLPLV